MALLKYLKKTTSCLTPECEGSQIPTHMHIWNKLESPINKNLKLWRIRKLHMYRNMLSGQYLLIRICDQICEKGSYTHIQFFNFKAM